MPLPFRRRPGPAVARRRAACHARDSLGGHLAARRRALWLASSFFFSFAAALSCGLQRYLGAVFFFLLAMSCARPRSVTAGAAMEPETVALSPLQVLYAIAETQRGASAASRSDGVRRTALHGRSYMCRAESLLSVIEDGKRRLRVRSHGSAAHCSSSLHRKRRIKNRT